MTDSAENERVWNFVSRRPIQAIEYYNRIYTIATDLHVNGAVDIDSMLGQIAREEGYTLAQAQADGRVEAYRMAQMQIAIRNSITQSVPEANRAELLTRWREVSRISEETIRALAPAVRIPRILPQGHRGSPPRPATQ